MIVRCLMEQHNLEENQSTSIVYSPFIQEKLDADINWAQHMGASYWADEIAAHCFGEQNTN